MLSPRSVDTKTDRDVLLEFHCRINYESECAWGRSNPYEQYREKWFSTSQPESYLKDLVESMKDERTIAEIWEDGNSVVAYLWVTFTNMPDYDISIAEINDIAVSPDFQRRGIALKLMVYIEQQALERGANLLRSGTGFENVASQGLHAKSGFQTYSIRYEKLLSPSNIESR
ncbi:MAG TPA: GNAT family N-acetyltransferase [Dehalococcoidia bacterium]|nr:GNAT family N-acetyltransferase [Dehalococcoidia bacterium]